MKNTRSRHRLVRAALAVALVSPVSAAVASNAASASVSVNAHVAIGSQHVVAVGSNGTVWTWGSLVPGPTGVGSRDSLVGPTNVVLPGSRTAVDVAATYNASFAVANDGSVWAWGSLGRGLGDSAVTTDARYTSPVQVTFPSGVSVAEIGAACEGVLARASNGDVYQWGTFYGNWQMSFNTPTKVPGVSGATSIARGCSTSFAVVSGGSAMAWGSNGGGRLGDGTTTDRPTPVTISLPGGKQISRVSTSSSHALAVATDGTLFGWGGNANGQLAADPNSLAFSSTPRSIAIGGTTALSAAASDSSPFSTVVTAANSVLKWGGWSSSEYSPSAVSVPTADLGSRTFREVTVFQNTTFLVANDNSLWAKGWMGSVDADGNCGATASDFPMWRDGATIPARPLVRTISQGQFGPAFNEDQIMIGRLETGAGTALPLDGSGTAVASVGTALTVTATSPRSSCYPVDQLTYQFSDDNGATWSSSGITTSTNSFAQTTVTVSYTPSSSGRKRAFFRVSNPDGKSASFRFTVGVAAASGGGGVVAPSSLPTVSTTGDTALAIGTDKFLYAWGAATAVTGEADAVKEPVRVSPAAATNETFRSVSIASRSVSSHAAAAVSESGKLYVWGSASTDLVLGGTSAVTSPTELAMPAGKKAQSVYLGLRNLCEAQCSTVVFGLVLDEAGAVYIWGGGAAVSTNPNSGFGAVVTAVPALAGLSFVSVETTNQMSVRYDSVVFRQSGGDLYLWTARRAFPCSPTCGWSAPVPSINTSAQFVYGTMWSGSTTSSGFYEVTSANALRFVPIANDGTAGTAVVLSLPGGRTVSQISRSRYGNQVIAIATDGSVWTVNGTYRPSRWTVPVDALPVTRFASSDGKFVIGAGGALWSLDTQNLPGTCSLSQGDEDDRGWQSLARVRSAGQFGPVFKQDTFRMALDSPNFIFYNHPTEPQTAQRPSLAGEYSSQLEIRPGSTVRLYTYFKSTCDGTSGLSVQWDLDDDGTFETNGTVGAVTDAATSLTTPGVIYGETWDGIVQADYRESYVDINSSSLGGALTQGGGRFIAVKYASATGSATQRFAIIVRPAKPTGRVGVTINNGARFTDSTEVTLNIVWPEYSTTALISNDGSFSDVREVPVTSSLRWSLPSEGSGLLSSVVYVRFKSLQTDWNGGWSPGEGDINYTDDIVLDLSPPEVASVSAATSSQASAQTLSGQASIMSTPSQVALVSMSAFDSASGISAVQVTTDPAVPGPERAFARSYRVTADRGSIAVRAKDNVGHWSDWKYASISGFSASVPANPGTPETPVTPSPAPEAPARQPEAPSSAAPQPAAGANAPVQAPGSGTTPGKVVVVAPAASAKATLSGSTARVTVNVPSALARTCTTKNVKGKKVTTCAPASIAVSVAGGSSRTVSAKAGNNSISLPRAKKGQTVTVKVGGKIVSRIKL